MKKSMCMLLAVMVLFLFAACGSESTAKAPGEDLVQTDIQNALSEYHAMQGACALEVKEHQLTKSLTQDKTYTAEYNVTAESRYAQFHYTANIAYTLYDQGWAMDSCEWTYVDYEVIRYPDGDSLADLDNQDEVDALVNPVFTGSANFFQANSLISTDWSPYATCTTERVTRWTYNSYSDRWDYLDTVIGNNKVQLTDTLVDFLTEALDIRDFTGTGFDVEASNEFFQVDTTHVELIDSSCFFSDDYIRIHFQSSFDRAFYNKDTESDAEGFMVVKAEIFREPPMTANADFPKYDMVVWLTMVDDTWVDNRVYSIPTYHLVSGEIYR